MRKFIGGTVLGVLIGAGTILGISQIPSVGNAIIKGNTAGSIENVEKDNQISNLELSNTKLKQDIEDLNTQLSEVNSQIELKNTQITEKQNSINQLTQEKEQLEKINNQLENVDIPNLTNEKIALEDENKQLKSELDTYKELVGSDVNYVALISSLQSQLDEKTTALNSANAELEQLKLDKSSLETRVAELETELAEVKEELANYKNLDTEIDTLNVESYEGTWYKNGTFEDYYTIENGVVTHNADEDKGLLNSIYNQMYLMMNTAGGKAVTLSDDGMTFETADNDVYCKYFINIEETVTPNYMFCGTYLKDNTQIKLNADNTTTMTVGETTYTGAYLVTTKQKNIGGNITRYNTITATYQTDDGPIVKVFENTSRDNLLLDGDVFYSRLSGFNGTVLSYNNSSFVLNTSYKNVGYIKVIAQTLNPITINAYECVTVQVDDYIKSSSGYNSGALCVNGCLYGYGALAYTSDELYNPSSENIYTDTFEFYIYFYDRYNVVFEGFSKIGTETDIKIVSVECSDNFKDFDHLGSEIYHCLYSSQVKEFNTITCSSVTDFTNGTYSDETNTIILSEDTATVNDITATTLDISATTDGTDIYQTVTLTYTTTEEEVETEHTVILTFKNKELLTTKLDDEDLSLSRK